MSQHAASVISLNKTCAAATQLALVADLRQGLRPSQQALGPDDPGGLFRDKKEFSLSLVQTSSDLKRKGLLCPVRDRRVGWRASLAALLARRLHPRQSTAPLSPPHGTAGQPRGQLAPAPGRGPAEQERGG